MMITDELESCGSRAFVASPFDENPRQTRMKLDVYTEVLQRLQESTYEEAALPDFEDLLWQHFNRLPARYALDVKVERAEDVLTHRKLLKLAAEDPTARLVFDVRCVEVGPPRKSVDSDRSMEEDAQSSSNPTGQVLAPPTFGSSPNLEAIIQGNKMVEDVDSVVNASSSTRTMHEITFSALDKPKLLSQLTNLLGELGLNIKEAHAFSTLDGYSLDVFVVDGWSQEETDGLKDALRKQILKLRDQFDTKQKSIVFIEHDKTENKPIPSCIQIPTDGIDEWEIDITQLKIGKKLASGSYGDLHIGTYCSQEVAIKFIKRERVNSEMLREFTQEVYIMRKVRHKNVIQFLGACTKAPTLCIVTQYMPRGSIYDFLHKQKNSFKFQTLLKVALDIAKGMCYLHQNNIIHRDLKSANILMDEHGLVKVADFGVARVQTDSGIMTCETGTYRWMAPEVIEHKPYNHKADVFSYGIVIWELLSCEIPYAFFTPLQAAVGVVQKNLRPKVPNKTHPKLRELLLRCWHKDPEQRPNFEEIIEILEEIMVEVGDEDPTKDNQFLTFIQGRGKRY